MPGWHSGWSADSVVCRLMHCVRSQPGTDYFVLCAVPSFVVLPGVLMYVSYMGELTV